MRFSDLEKLQIKNKSGQKLGKVHDIHAILTASGLSVKEIHFGGIGLMERIGLSRKGRSIVEWKDILEIRSDSIIVDERKIRKNEE